MLIESKYERGAAFIDGREIVFVNYHAEVPDRVGRMLLQKGEYTVKGKKQRSLGECRRLLMIRGGGLGDVLLTHCIRKHILQYINPKVSITFLTDKKYNPVVKYDPTVRHVIKMDSLNPDTYDHVVNLNDCEFRPEFSQTHKIDLLALSMGVGTISDRQLFYKTDKPERKWAKRTLGGGIYVGVVLRTTCGSKHMGFDQIRKICELLTRSGLKPIIFDTKRKAGGSFEDCFDARGKYNVRQCAALLERCVTTLTPDTGFMHLAVALGGRVCVYFGSIGHEIVLTPGRVTKIIPNVSCYPCNSFGCPDRTERCLKYDPEYIAEIVKAEVENEEV